jgi:hypothetical protein
MVDVEMVFVMVQRMKTSVQLTVVIFTECIHPFHLRGAVEMAHVKDLKTIHCALKIVLKQRACL